MTDSEKLDLILTKLQRIEDKLGITDDLQRTAYDLAQRRIELDRMTPEKREAILKAQQFFGQNYGSGSLRP